MRFLFPNYNKPGKGVDENAPQKRRFFLFFELFFRKFTKLITLNMLYLVVGIPTFVLLFFVTVNSISMFFTNMVVELPLEEAILNSVPFAAVFIALILACLWGLGPVTAGLTYIVRNYGREEHAWLWSDFWEHTWKNFKQSSIVFIIDLIVIFVFFVAINFYSSQQGGIFFFINIFLLIFFLIYTMMHLYIYPMMVTFKLPLRALYKNALIFATARFPQNILIVAIILAVVVLATINILVMVFFIPLFLFSLCGYISTFCVYPTLQKYMIKSDDEVKQD